MVIKISCMAEEINTFSGIDIPISEVHTCTSILVWNKWSETFENWIYYSIWTLFFLSLKNDA